MNPIILNIPGWAAPWLIVATSLLTLLTIIANATAHLPDARIDEVKAASPRLAALLVLSRHWGIVVTSPAWKAAWTVIRGAVKLVPAAMVLCALSCTGPQVVTEPDGAVIVTPASWVQTAEGAVAILNTALPGAADVIAVLPIDAQAKRAAISAINAAEAGLPRVSQALAAYAANPNITNRCAARAAIKLVDDLILAAADGVAAIGFATPAMILMALGGLGSLVDELMPVCSTPDAGAALAHVSESANISRRLSRLPAGLRPLPGAAQ